MGKSEEKTKIQVVVPAPLAERYEKLQMLYKGEVKSKLIEDMITSFEKTLFGQEHPAYEKQLSELDECWDAIRRTVVKLIEDEAKAEAAARENVTNTLRVLEEEVSTIPQLRTELDKVNSQYAEEQQRSMMLEKKLEDSEARVAAANAALKEAQRKNTELQDQLNNANETIVKQMQELLQKYSTEKKA